MKVKKNLQTTTTTTMTTTRGCHTSASLFPNSPSHHTHLLPSLPRPRTFLRHPLTCRPRQWTLFSCCPISSPHPLWYSTWVQWFGREWIIARQRRPRWSALMLATLNLALSACRQCNEFVLHLIVALYLPFIHTLCSPALEASDPILTVHPDQFLTLGRFSAVILLLPFSELCCLIGISRAPLFASFFSHSLGIRS